MNRFRILTIGLIFSGALNVGLIATMIFSYFETSSLSAISTFKEQTQTNAPENRRLLLTMSRFSFPELVAYLTNRELQEEGYTKRDLALAALVSFHSFDLQKALSASPIQKRQFSLSSDQTVELYPGLNDEQYEAIIRFAYQEKWPLTSQGLFRMLKKWPKNTRDLSLIQSFLATPEFHILQVLFQRTGAPQDDSLLLDLVCEGNWEMLSGLIQEQTKGLDLSVDKRRSLLLDYIAHQSCTAAKLLIKTDFHFAKTRFKDESLLVFLSLLKEKCPDTEKFCMDLLHSSHQNAVCHSAAEKLYAFAGEEAPVPLDLQAVKMRFGFSPSVTSSPSLQKSEIKINQPLEHIVKEGENLWKIARLHKVKVDDIIRLNNLEKDRLFPGMVLRIP